tara:strand:+ start:507 stop:1127 length:621 start_codon:yes stop_codon:yes gene_type:complete
MAITTYSELKTSIANWLNRDDLTTQIPDFISLAEENASLLVRHWRMENRATATLDSQYEALPARFIAPIRLSITSGDTFTIELISQNQMVDRRAAARNTAGRPQFYALTQGEIEVFPTPDTDYTLEMVYYEKAEALSDTNTTNWLLTHYPSVYLYGSLVHTAPFLKDDPRLQTWGTLYQSAIAAVNQDGQNAKTSGSGATIKIRSY